MGRRVAVEQSAAPGAKTGIALHGSGTELGGHLDPSTFDRDLVLADPGRRGAKAASLNPE